MAEKILLPGTIVKVSMRKVRALIQKHKDDWLCDSMLKSFLNAKGKKHDLYLEVIQRNYTGFSGKEYRGEGYYYEFKLGENDHWSLPTSAFTVVRVPEHGRKKRKRNL